MDQPVTIDLDPAKNAVQGHAGDVKGTIVCRRPLRRAQVVVFFSRSEPCRVGMVACAGARYWARELTAVGHDVRLMPPTPVTPYVTRGKTHAGDAEAIGAAATRPTMRFVPVKSADRQAALPDHKARDVLVRQRTQIANAIRAHLGRFGIVVAQGIHNVDRRLDAAGDVHAMARPALDMLAGPLRDTQARIEEVTARISGMQGDDALARRRTTVPGTGAISSSAFAAATPDVAARPQRTRLRGLAWPDATSRFP